MMLGKKDEVLKNLAGIYKIADVAKYLNTLTEELLLMPIGTQKKKAVGISAHAIESAYMTRERSASSYESHKRCIDIHYIFSGKEVIETAPVSKLKVSSAYNKKDDYTLYSNDYRGKKIILEQGMVAVFFPEDAHMPALTLGKSARVFKIVVKYPV